jgi:uncharacterized membrane protein
MSDEIQPQNEIMRKNVAAIMDMQRKEAAGRTVQDRLAELMTHFSGSMAFVYFHAIWFGLWMLLNLGLLKIPHITEFDPYPFGLLTLVVSLEAIFLSTFVLIAQNNLAAVSERRAELDLQVNLLAEQKTAKILELLDHIARELDSMHAQFNYRPDAETQALKLSPEPQDVLEVIEQEIKDDSEATPGLKQKLSEQVAAVKARITDQSTAPEEDSPDRDESKEPDDSA